MGPAIQPLPRTDARAPGGPLTGAIKGAVAGGAGGFAVGSAVALLAAPRAGMRAIGIPMAVALQFAMYGFVAGAIAEPTSEYHPERPPLERMARGAVLPGAVATGVLGAASVVFAGMAYRSGQASLVEAAALAVAGTVVGGAAGAASGAVWGLEH